MNSKAKISILILCLISAQAFAVTVTWVDGLAPPSAWTVDPNNPGTSDTITFSGPLDFVYGSSCSARGALGGTPQITVDNMNKEVVLGFQGPPPTQCPAIWQPVSGLQGEFGPLPSGHWTFKCTVPAIAFNISFTVGTPASVYYVDQDAPGPVHNGANWLWAFRTIQDALAMANPGDTILVAEGIYKPDQGAGVTPGDRSASFQLQDGIILIGGYAGFGAPSPDAQDPETYTTVLSGDLAGNDLYAILNTEENSYHVVTAQGPADLGTFIDGVVITHGQATGASPDHMGAGLLVQDANVILSGSVLSENQAALGGAVGLNQGSLVLVNSQVSGNSALLYGAGIYSMEGALTLTNCLITGNSAFQAEYIGGSAIYSLNGNTHINSSTITDNDAPSGRAITSLSWSPTTTGELTITNSILYNGGSELLTSHPGTTSVSNTDIQGGWSGTGTGNIDADPLFVGPGNWSVEGQWIGGDYHLQDGSPCIDQGSTALLPADITDLDVNGNTAEALPVDLDGAARVQGSQTDMGVYETEIIVTPPPSGPNWTVADSFNITHTPTGPWTGVRLSATVTTSVEMNFKGELSLTIQSTSAAGGNWTATFIPDPGIIGPGTYSVTLEIVGEDVDLSQVTSGVEHDLAELKILVRPVQP